MFALLALSVGCELAQGGGLAGSPDAGDNADATLDAEPGDASLETSFPDAPADDGGDANVGSDAAVDAPFDAGVDAPFEAGPVLTFSGGTYALHGADAGICSTNGAATSLQLINDRDAAVDLFWVNYGCTEASYGVVQPLGTTTVGTYVNHVWRVRNDSDKKFLAEFVLLNGGASYMVTVH
jgi:hypothetical protein